MSPKILGFKFEESVRDLQLSKIVNALKGLSSRRYGQAGFKKPRNGKALWSPSYFAVSVEGAPIEVLIKYIKEQQRPKK